jgi:hypothetical protein
MTRAEEYRERAAECERLAGETRDPQSRDILLNLAKRWRELAAEEEAGGTP